MPRSRRLVAWLDRHSGGLLAGAALLLVASLCSRANAKPFDHDEIFTVLEAGLPTVSAIWQADRSGLDLMPPLNTLATRYVRAGLGTGRVPTRLPAILGFSCGCLVIFAVVRRRAGAAMALLAAAMPVFTSVYWFAFDARGYGLAFGLSALAFYAWLEAAARRRRLFNLALMSVALCAGVWAHYFSALVALPIALGEATRLVKSGRFDWPMLAALAAAFVGLLPLLPLVLAAHGESTSFWGHAVNLGLWDTYSFLLVPVVDWGIAPGVCAVACWGLVGLALLERLFAPARATTVANRGPAPADRPFEIHELVAAIALAGLPVAGMVLAKLVGSGLVPRYLMPASVGLSICLAAGLGTLLQERSRRIAIAGVASIGWLAIVVAPLLAPPPFQNPVDADPVLVVQLQGSQPVVVADGLQFLPLWYYAPAALRAHLVYLADEDLALTRTGSATIDANLLRLRRWSDVAAQPLEPFLAVHQAFLVLDDGKGWLLEELRSRHFSVNPVSSDGPNQIYSVIGH